MVINDQIIVKKYSNETNYFDKNLVSSRSYSDSMKTGNFLNSQISLEGTIPLKEFPSGTIP